MRLLTDALVQLSAVGITHLLLCVGASGIGECAARAKLLRLLIKDSASTAGRWWLVNVMVVCER